MTEFIAEIFSKLFNGNSVLATTLVSMVPLMELKGGIPFGMSEAFWGDKALGRWQAFGFAYLGCFIVTVVLYFLFIPIMSVLRKTKVFKGIANYIDNRIKKQSNKIEGEVAGVDGQEHVVAAEAENASPIKKRLLKMLGVLMFVAIPLPLTGVWMGTCLAVILKLNFWETVVAVGVGNLIAGLIISTICVIFPQFTHILIYIFLIIIAVAFIYEIIKNKIKSKK